MRKVLIICGSFPPQSFVGGLRPAMFAKYLEGFGWEPWILTRGFTKDDPRFDEKMPIILPEHLLSKIIRVDYSIVNEKLYLDSRTIIGKLRDFFYPEYSSPPGLYFKVKKIAEEIVVQNSFDLILSTCPDQWELTLGSYLSQKYNIKLIADFRDIVEQEIGLKRTFRGYLQSLRFLIRRYLTTRKVDHIITVSEYHRSVLSKKLNRNCSLIYNGFDDSLFKPLFLTDHHSLPFRIIYIGRILDIWYRNPQLLLISIDELINENKLNISDISVEFYGSNKEKLLDIINQLNNPKFLKFEDRIAYNDVPHKLNEAQMLLVLTNIGRNGILTTKFFEYMGVKKPVLCIPGDQNELDKLISKYSIGYSISEKEDLKTKLIDWISKFRDGSFPNHIESNVEYFSRKEQTKLLSEIFNEVTRN